MNIVFRTDASTMMGSGHVMRCLTLADALREKGHQVSFVCRKYPGNLNHIISKNKFEVRELFFEDAQLYQEQEYSNDYNRWLWVSTQRDADETLSFLRSTCVDWIIVDHYSLDVSWERQLRAVSKQIMVIDDLANRQHDCDILLDQNYYIDSAVRYDELTPPYCMKLLGQNYALIRSNCVKIREQRMTAGKFNFSEIKKIVIFMGGSDINNMTLQILEYLHQHSILHKYNVDVILGASNLHKVEIENFCDLNKAVSYFIAPDNYTDFLIKADLFIGAGGSSVYERCMSGIPSLVFSSAENQRKICVDVACTGAHIFVENVNDLLGVFKKLTPELLRILSEKSIALFSDYQGADGVVNAIQSC